MQVGDLVKLPSKLGAVIGCSNLLGIVVALRSQNEPTADVQWFRIEGTMQHRIDMLELVNASR